MAVSARTMVRATTGVANKAFKKLLVTVMFIAAITSIATVSIVVLAYRITK